MSSELLIWTLYPMLSCTVYTIIMLTNIHIGLFHGFLAFCSSLFASLLRTFTSWPGIKTKITSGPFFD